MAKYESITMASFSNNTRNNHGFHFQLVFALVILASCCSLVSSTSILGKVHVFVMNSLGASKKLDIQCSSSEDRLGFRALHDGEIYDWKFRVNFSGSTKFVCFMAWINDNNEILSGTFLIYKHKRDRYKCNGDCLWHVKQSGIYFVDNAGYREEQMFTWPTPPPSKSSNHPKGKE
ncbi:hypothetical protein AQUCO_00200421v1 [Aquilegia coerulea]|uniref:S-protein homolog n=1 Tax=Aquilegia coerulea TaxID=218851 RepID=A0A2G5F336_AQUCA|nr:hypothetical protein AQUCO_00200421v1 [Aquilegia coerulea]